MTSIFKSYTLTGIKTKDNTLFQRLDPRGKLASTIVFSFLLVFINNIIPVICSLLLSLLAIYITHPSYDMLKKRLILTNSFVFLLWLLIILNLKSINLLSLSTADQLLIRWLILVSIKVNTLLLIFVSLINTSSIDNILHALSHFYIPTKIVQLFFFVYKYVHILYIEYYKLERAMKVRSFNPRSNLHTYRSYAWLFGVLLIRSYDRSERIYNAMICRGFNGVIVQFDSFKWHKRDLFFGVIMLIIFISLIILNFTV